jgi:hypothetical protein
MRLVTALILSAALAAGCKRSQDDDTETDDVSDDTADTSDSSDTNDSSDTTDSSDTSDTSDTSEPDCSDPGTAAPGTASGYGTCYQGELQCGDVITDTTVGGLSQLNYAAYEDWWCLGHAGLNQNYDAPERSYYFYHPPGKSVKIKLSTPSDCRKTMSLRAVWVSNESECLTGNQMPGDCTAGYAAAGSGELIDSTYPDYKYRIIVDGRGGAEGVYTLEVECN